MIVSEIKINFTDSKQVEQSFYHAFCNRDIELMQHVWDQSDDALCIHPGSPRIYSFELIIASWREIFASPDAVTIEITEPVYKFEETVAVHYLKENLSVDNKLVGSVYATNIYHQTVDGWKMIAHHASPAFSESESKINPSLH